jgi:hypothetical protein
MASVSRQIGWSQESNLLYQILKQITRLTSIIFKLNPKYKVYTALLSQEGASAPEAIELENTIGNITFNYRTEGQYDIILPAEIPLTSKIFINNSIIAESVTDTVFNRIITTDGNDGFAVQKGYYFLYTGANNLRLYTISDVNTFSNGVIAVPICIEIRVYN